jgi:pimeloyl-ACP methyl ester carboxylesterase
VADFRSFDDVRLSYEIDGDGPPVLLLHGFATDGYINWVRPGITDKLNSAGYRTIALDQRGHGLSDKPHEPEAYENDAMVRDAQALLDHLGIDACFVCGYSMGARNALGLVTEDERPRAAVLGGVGSNMLHAREFGGAIAEAMRAPDKNTVADKFARSFRDFADLTGADREALAAIQSMARPPLERLAQIGIPTLVLCADNDPLVANPQELADAIPGAKVAIVGGTHLNVVNNPEFQRELLEFLEEHRSLIEER